MQIIRRDQGSTVEWFEQPIDAASPFDRLQVAVFATRWGRTFTGDASLLDGWRVIDSIRARGPWFTDETDMRFVLVARLMTVPVGMFVPISSTITRLADAEGVDWDVPVMPEMVRGYAAASSDARSLTGFMSGDQSGYIVNVDRYAPGQTAVWRLFDVSYVAVTSPPGDVWLQSPYIAERNPSHKRWLEGTAHSPGGEWSNAWNGPGSYVQAWRTVPSYSMAGERTETPVLGVEGYLQRWTVRLQAGQAAPFAPTITTPRAWVNTDLAWPVTIVPRQGLAGPVTAWSIQRTVGSVVTYWDNTSHTWVSGARTFAWTGATYTMPPGAIPRGSQWALRVATVGTSGGLGAWSDPVALVSSAEPTVALSVQEMTAGGAVPVLAPLVAVSGAPAPGQQVESVAVQVLDQSGEVVAAQTLAGSTMSWRVSPNLDQGATYTVRATATQQGGAVSAPVDQVITVAAPVPPAPEVALSWWRNEVSGVHGVQVLVGLLDTYDWSEREYVIRVSRRRGAGEWSEGIAAGPYISRDRLALVDYLPESGGWGYRVRVEVKADGGSVLPSPWSAERTVAVEAECGWIMPYGMPERAVRALSAVVRTGFDVTSEAVRPIGSREYVVSGRVASAHSGTAEVEVADLTSADALEEILALGADTLMVLPPVYDYMAQRRSDVAPRRLWFRPSAGRVEVGPVADGEDSLERTVSWSWVERPAPPA